MSCLFDQLRCTETGIHPAPWLRYGSSSSFLFRSNNTAQAPKNESIPGQVQTNDLLEQQTRDIFASVDGKPTQKVEASAFREPSNRSSLYGRFLAIQSRLWFLSRSHIRNATLRIRTCGCLLFRGQSTFRIFAHKALQRMALTYYNRYIQTSEVTGGLNG
jgi:hypothetical protein